MARPPPTPPKRSVYCPIHGQFRGEAERCAGCFADDRYQRRLDYAFRATYVLIGLLLLLGFAALVRWRR